MFNLRSIFWANEYLEMFWAPNEQSTCLCCSYMWCFGRFGTICTIQKTWKYSWRNITFTESNTPPWLFLTFLKLYEWYKIVWASHMSFLAIKVKENVRTNWPGVVLKMRCSEISLIFPWKISVGTVSCSCAFT